MPSALITGITGQDGSYLAELLLAKGYDVHGLVRGQNNPRLEQVRELLPDVRLHTGDLTDFASLVRALRDAEPDEVYNLGAISFVAHSWDNASLTADVTAKGVLNLLEAVRLHAADDLSRIRFYQASSSEMFGHAVEAPQRETTRFWPRSPYGVAKAFGHHLTVNYRESYGMHASSGILFNHESPRRGREFVTRHVSETVAKIKLGLASELPIGNPEARRDWGYAADYVDAMWRMLQREEASDYVIGTGRQHSVREFIEISFDHVGLDPDDFVRIDPRRYRPAEVDTLLADPTKAREELGWTARTSLEALARLMVESDLEAQEGASGRRRGGPGSR